MRNKKVINIVVNVIVAIILVFVFILTLNIILSGDKGYTSIFGHRLRIGGKQFDEGR